LLEDSSLHFIPPPDKKTLGEMNSHGSTNYTYLFEKVSMYVYFFMSCSVL
jgi:hypothetical protein